MSFHDDVEIKELLPDETRHSLTQQAQRLYQQIWNNMNHKHVTHIVLTDDVISTRTRIVLSRLAAAKAELVEAGLLVIAPKGAGWFMYAFPDQSSLS